MTIEKRKKAVEMRMSAEELLLIISFIIWDSCGLVYIAKSFISFAWKIIDLQLQIYDELDAK